jgi:hypothetical protein
MKKEIFPPIMISISICISKWRREIFFLITFSISKQRGEIFSLSDHDIDLHLKTEGRNLLSL